MGLTFFGKCNIVEDEKHPISDKSFTIRFTLIILAFLSLFGGIIGVPEILGGKNSFQDFVNPVFSYALASNETHHLEDSTIFIIMGISLFLGLIVSIYFLNAYAKASRMSEVFKNNAIGKIFYKISSNLFYVDKIYESIIAKPFRMISSVFAKYFDILILDKGIIGGLSSLFTSLATLLRRYQTGNVNFYALIMVIGAIFILFYITYIIYTGINEG